MTQEDLLEWIRAHPRCTGTDIRKGYPGNNYADALSALRRKKLVQRISEPLNTHTGKRAVYYIAAP